MYRECPTETPESHEQEDGYRLRYILVWLVPMIFFGAFITSTVLGVWWLSVDQYFRYSAYAFALALDFLILFLFMRGSTQQLRYRIGMDLFGSLVGDRDDVAPDSLDAILNEVSMFIGEDSKPNVVGNGWSNVLRQQTTESPRIHMRCMVGRVPGMPLTWYAGTSVMDVQKQLKEENLQLVNVPSYGGVTLGAWVATIGHGMTGRAFSHGMISVKAKVLDLHTGIVTDDGPDMLLYKFGRGHERAAKFLVLTVTLKDSPTLVQNSKMLRQARWLATVDDAKWVLRKEAQVAVVFIGSKSSLALTWQPHIGSDVVGGGLLMDLSIITFAVVGIGLSKPSGNGRDRTETLDNAPLFFHVYLSPIYIWFLLLFNLKNIEMFTTDIPLTPELTLKLTAALQDVYKKFKGRCELRFLGYEQFTRTAHFCTFLHMLHSLIHKLCISAHSHSVCFLDLRFAQLCRETCLYCKRECNVHRHLLLVNIRSTCCNLNS